MQPAAPRHFMPSNALPGAGLPHDRLALLAARHAFVDLKLSFQQAVADIDGPEGAWLRHQVRSAEQPSDLWLLRAPVFAALAGIGIEVRRRRQALRRSLDQLFPDSELTTAFGPF
jgi:hypothetical protein